MKEITKHMIKIYGIKRAGLDFMGYKVDKMNNLSFHHLIVPNRHGGKQTVENGAILMQGNGWKDSNSHDYLHLIERIDPEIFYKITSEMIDENIKGKIDIENLRRIRDLLEYFEKEHANKRGRKGKLLIKQNYIIRPKL